VIQKPTKLSVVSSIKVSIRKQYPNRTEANTSSRMTSPQKEEKKPWRQTPLIESTKLSKEAGW
jgi:hypothetical protein